MEVFGNKDLKGVNSMLISVPEDFSGPVISSTLLFVDDMDKNSKFTFVGVIFEGFNYLRLWNVLVLNT